jgi:hypothetical protein
MVRLAMTVMVSSLALASPAFGQSPPGLSGVFAGVSAGPAFFFDQEIEAGALEAEIDYDAPGYVIGGEIGYALARV